MRESFSIYANLVSCISQKKLLLLDLWLKYYFLSLTVLIILIVECLNRTVIFVCVLYASKQLLKCTQSFCCSCHPLQVLEIFTNGEFLQFLCIYYFLLGHQSLTVSVNVIPADPQDGALQHMTVLGCHVVDSIKDLLYHSGPNS